MVFIKPANKKAWPMVGFITNYHSTLAADGTHDISIKFSFEQVNGNMRNATNTNYADLTSEMKFDDEKIINELGDSVMHGTNNISQFNHYSSGKLAFVSPESIKSKARCHVINDDNNTISILKGSLLEMTMTPEQKAMNLQSKKTP